MRVHTICFAAFAACVLCTGCREVRGNALRTVRETPEGRLTMETPERLPAPGSTGLVVVRVSHGWTGGMGEAVFAPGADRIAHVNHTAVYISSALVSEAIRKGGGLPDCYRSEPEIKIAGQGRLEMRRERNWSIPDAPEQSYYELVIEGPFRSQVRAVPCRK